MKISGALLLKSALLLANSSVILAETGKCKALPEAGTPCECQECGEAELALSAGSCTL